MFATTMRGPLVTAVFSNHREYINPSVEKAWSARGNNRSVLTVVAGGLSLLCSRVEPPKAEPATFEPSETKARPQPSSAPFTFSGAAATGGRA